MQNISNSNTNRNDYAGYEDWLDSLEAQRHPERPNPFSEAS